MRKTIYVMAVAALVFAACKKEAAPVAEKTYSMEIIMESSEVKTAFSDGTIIWKLGDKIGGRQRYYKESDGGRTTQAKSWSMSKDAAATSISTTWTTPKEGTEIQYYFFYPVDRYATTWYTDGDYVKPLVTLSEKQTPVAGSYDPMADILVSKIISVTEPQTKTTPEFIRINSLCNITVKNLPSTANVDSVRFSAKAGGAAAKMAGEFYALMSTGTFGSFKASKTHITLDCSALEAAANSAEGLSTYFSCLPFSLAAGDSFKVEVFAGGVNYVKDVILTTPMEFAQGRMAKFSVDMAGCNATADWIKVEQKATSSMSQGSALAYVTFSTTASVSELNYGFAPAADYLSAVANGTLDDLYTSVATISFQSYLDRINGGSAVNLSVSNGTLVPAADYYVIAKVKKNGSEEYTKIASKLKADFIGFLTQGHTSGPGYPYHKFYGAGLAAVNYICVAKSAIASPTNANCLAYFNENTKTPLSATVLSTICDSGATGYGVFKTAYNLGSGVEYIEMVQATATDGSTKFCWSTSTTK